MDEIAPVKRFIIKPDYKQWLLEEAKKLMQERVKARQTLKNSPEQRRILHI